MSALLASSFVGRVAAFKATKIQVRIFLASRDARDAGTRRAETRRRGTRWDARDGMGSRATGRGDAGRARGEATALGRRERAERNDLDRTRDRAEGEGAGEGRARRARYAIRGGFRIYIVGISLGFGDSRRGSVLSRERWIGFADSRETRGRGGRAA